MTIDLDAIEAAARGATPGPWRVDDDDSHWLGVVVAGRPELGFAPYQIADRINGDRRGTEAERPSPEANAHYIATMDPQTTLALVERVRELEAIIREGARKARSYDEWRMSWSWMEGQAARMEVGA